MNTAPRLYLIGYRGTGKTTVGQVVARRRSYTFVDADVVLESQAGRSIAEIFAREGEPSFRDRESDVLAQLSSRPQHVIATGGGIILRESNRNILRNTGFVVWLDGSAETIWQRLVTDPTTAGRRPNLTAKGGIDEVRDLLAMRELLYRETAQLRLQTDAASPESLADAILDAWTGS